MMPFPIELDILQNQKNGTAYVISHNYAKIKVDSYDSLPLDKKLILHNIIINMMSVLDTEQNHNNYNIFLEKVHINQLKINDIFLIV